MALNGYASKLDPQRVKDLFFYSQIGLGLVFGFLFFRMRPRGSEGKFKTYGGNSASTTGKSSQPRRLGSPASSASPESEDPLANAKMRPRETLRLAGLSVHGAPHEILGVSALASAEEIQRAYRDLIKRYHPDKIGRPGSREWADAQGLAEALNSAKEEMLKRLKARGK